MEWAQLGVSINGESEFDLSGYSVSVNDAGNRVAIGAIHNDAAGSDAGHVRVYEYTTSNPVWSQLGVDINGEAAGDLSGQSVSLNDAGDRVAIGAPNNDGAGSNAGHVRIFEYIDSSWIQLGADIDGEAASDESGNAVSLNGAGDRVAIGAHYNDGAVGSFTGHVRIYEYSDSSFAWTQLGSDIDGEASNDKSGTSVSLNNVGDRVAIGAPFNDATGGSGGDAGHVRIYEFGDSVWAQIGLDIDGEATGDNSGNSVSLNNDGDRVAIGAIYNDGNGNSAGHVRIYEYVITSSAWTQLGSDIDGETFGDLSGHSLSMSSTGDRVAVGAHYNDANGDSGSFIGHVRIYEYDNSSSSWGKLGSDINGDAYGDFSGWSVSLNGAGDRVACGAIYNDVSDSNAGHVRVMELGVVPSSNSNQTALLIGSILGGVGVLILLACIVYFLFGSQCVKKKHAQTSQQKEEPRLDLYRFYK